MPLFEWNWSWASKPLRQPWHSILLAVFSLALSYASAYSYLSTEEFISASTRTTGVVTRMMQADDLSFPQVSFIDDTGVRHIFESKLHAKPPQYSVGESVVVLYSQQSGHAQIEDFFDLWFVTLVTGILGAALGVAALLTWRYRHHLFEQYSKQPL